MMAAHATCTMNGSPSATWPTASTTAADAGAAATICAATLAAAALSATYAFKRDVALSSVSRAHRARAPRRIPRPTPIDRVDPKPSRDADRDPPPRPVATPRRSLSTAAPRPRAPAPDARAPDAARRRIQRARVSSTHRSRAVVLVALARVPPSTPRPARADRDPIEGSRRAFIAPPRSRPSRARPLERPRPRDQNPPHRARALRALHRRRARLRASARAPPPDRVVASRSRASSSSRSHLLFRLDALRARRGRAPNGALVLRRARARGARGDGRACGRGVHRGVVCGARASIGSGADARARAIFLYDILPAFYSI